MTAVPTASARSRFVFALGLACAAFAFAAFASFAWLVSKRTPFPFELEWMEGAMVDHVARLVAGQGIYVAPSVTFVPYMYNPLFYWVSAGVARVVGIGFLPLRLVSVTATFAAFALVFELVRRETRALLPSFLAAGLYASTYAITGSWFDAGRVDSLAIALCLASIFVARRAATRAAFVATAALVVLAFATRQNALPLLPALWLWFARRHGLRRSAWFAAPALAAIAMGIALLNHATRGWYWFYAFALPFDHSTNFAMVPDASMLPFVVATGLTVYYFIRGFSKDVPASPGERSARRSAAEFHACTAGALVVMGVTGRMHDGSFYNDYIPIYAALSVTYGLGLGGALGANPSSNRAGALALGASLLQFAALSYDPRPYAPSPANLADGKRFVRIVASIPGDVLIPEHGYVAAMAGKRSFIHQMALIDLMRAPAASDLAMSLNAQFAALLEHHRFGAVVLDSLSPFQDATSKSYHLAARIPFHPPRYFFANADSTAFHSLWLPKPN